MVQWLGFHLPMHGHRFSPWSGKIPHAGGHLSPCTTTPEAHALDRACAPNKGRECSPYTATRECPQAATKTQHN